MSMLDKFRLTGKKIIVTGGAGGIGETVIYALAEVGAEIAVIDLDPKGIERVVNNLQQRGTRAMGYKADLTSQDEVKAMVEAVVSEMGTVDVLWNNAGIFQNVPAEDMNYAEWLRIIDINLNTVFAVSQAVAPIMIANKRGTIINTASMSGLVVNVPQKQAGYNTAKAGIIQLTRTLATEWAPYGIRVNSISPGYIATNKVIGGDYTHLFDYWLERTPMHRMGSPEELAGAVIYLASDASSFTTGENIVIDGGYSIV